MKDLRVMTQSDPVAASQSEPSDSTAENERPQRKGWRQFDRPLLIICTLFFVTGVIGLPLLWLSHCFSSATKVILSIVVTIYTAMLIAGVYLICAWAYQRIVESL